MNPEEVEAARAKIEAMRLEPPQAQVRGVIVASNDLLKLFDRAKRAFEAMTPEQQKAHREAQRASWVRGMTTPCEHGVLDFEQCPDCRAAAMEPTP